MGMNREVYSYLLKSYGREPRYWLAFLAVILQTLFIRIVSLIVIAHLAGNITSGDFDAARKDILLYLAVAAAGLACRFARDMLAIPAENKVYSKLLIRFYQKLVSKDMSFFRDHQTGYLAGAFRQHGEGVMDLARLFRTDIIQTSISMTIPATVLLVASWKVGLAAFAVVIAQAIYVIWSSSTVLSERARAHEAYRKLSGAVSDDVTNIVAYKTSGASQQATGRIKVLLNEEVDAFWQRRKKLAFMDAPRETITFLGIALAFWVIIGSAEHNAATVGLVILTVTYMIQIFNNVGLIPDIIARHDDLVSKLYPTLEYTTDKNETIKDPAKPKKLKIDKAGIEIDGVSFSYPDAKGNKTQVFDALNLGIKGGEQVGVVGLSGAGKSTLASLLMRFDEIDGGSIKIDGTDIREVRQEELRENIAYVPQEPLLFHRTIRENLQYFGKDLSEASMIRAAKAAHAHEFIEKLPSGYDTMVGERGVKLSGGQKQRVVIARAILKQAPIMLFDEATSALDSESERIIQRALPQIIGRRTAVVIAHRLSTVAGLDRIIVMQDGKIIEDGTHAQLLKLKGRYYSLWQKQTNNDK